MLTINNSTTSSQSVTACDSYTWSLNGTTYTTSGTYTYTSTNAAGCTDVKTLVLTITPSTSNTTTASASCSYTWANNNQTYTTSGLYTGLTDNCVTKKLNLTITAPPTNFSSGGINYVVTSPTTVSVVGGNSIGAVVIPDSVTTVCGTYSVTSISDYAFYPSPRLTSVIIGNSVTSIGVYAFQGSPMLTSVTLGTSVTSIGNFAFATQWSPIRSIICNSSIPPPINWMVFNGSGYADDCTLTVPDASIAAYRAADTWNRFLVLCVNQTENTTTVTTCGSYTWSVNGQTYLKSGTYKHYTGCLTEILVLSIPITSGGINYELTSPTTLSVGRNASATGVVVIPASITNSCGTYAVTGISEFAFEYTSITSVTLPNSITSIGNRAFRDCSSLTSINLPNSITSIVGGAFKNCSSLTSVTLPNSVTTLEGWTFHGCSNLTSVTLPNSLTRIDDGAFLYCSSLTSLVIPNSVTSIGKNVFENCSSLASVTLPNSLTSIGDYAFQSTRLTSVVIPNQITRINTGVFYECSQLQYITIGTSVTSIGATAFSRLNSLNTIFCNAITPPTVHHDTFWSTNTGGVPLIVPDELIEAYRVADTWKYFPPICVNQIVNTTTLTSCSHYTWSVNGQTYTKSGTYTNYTGCNTNILVLTIPFTVDGINYELTSPTTVSVGSNRNATGVVVIPASITNSCGTYAVTGIIESAFQYCTGITSITIPNSITSISNYAFDRCTSITSVTLPNSITSIGNRAFMDCSSLTSINLPNSITSIVYGAFEGCSSLTSVTVPNSVTMIDNKTFYGCSSLTSVTLPNSLTSIGDYAFYNNSSLTSLMVPNSVTSIGNNVFENCSSLTSVTLPNSLTSIGDYAFQWSGLTSVVIPNQITRINTGVFNYCRNLRYITIGTSVTSIGATAFTRLENLTTIFCNAITPPTVHHDAFWSTSYGGKGLIVPDASIEAYRAADIWEDFPPTCVNQTVNTTNVTACGSYVWSLNGTFYSTSGTYSKYTGCHKETLVLTIIQNTSNTTTVSACGSYTWANNNQTYTTNGVYTGLTTNCVTEKLNLTFTAPPTNFSSGGINYVVTSPTTVSIGSNASATGVVVISDSVTTACGTYAVTGIINNAFQNCTGITSITIPNSVTSISDYAFDGCTRITSVTLPNSITSIGNTAFRNCSSLNLISLPIATTSIGDNVFEACSSLSTVTIPNSLTSIGQYAFLNSGLTSIVIPNSITSIGTGVFDTCRSLMSVTIPSFVTSIGTGAFAKCSSLSSLICNVITPVTISNNVFQNVNQSTCTLTVPNASLAAYREALIWKDFTPINCANPTVNTTTILAYNIYTWEVNGQTYTTNGTYSLVTGCETKNLNLTILAQPAPPTGLSCFEVAVWNQEISDYEIFADLPVAPTVNCYQSTEWDDTTCSWIISGTQPDAPLLSCSQTATWNATTCEYDIVTTIPAIPSIACYQSAVWNYDTCLYDITGTQPAQPSLSCYETATWNATTCAWDVIRDLPSAPQVNCYQTVAWNESVCDYVVTGSMPEEPEVNCYQTATWNATTCQYDITGELPEEPTLLCYQRAIWNASICNYDVVGEKPSEPVVACYETATWNATTCVWDITGSQPVQPVVACYQTATFDTLSCSWVVTGTQPLVPSLACYETASWNSDSCQYDIIGTQPAAPTSLLCYQTATFNTSLCSWVVTGSQPKITSISGAGAICNGTSKTLTLASGTFGSIQWQSSTTSATATDFTNISGATNPVLLTVTPAVTTWYRAYASFGTCPSATSSAVAVTVSQPTAVGTLSALSSSICTATGTNITLSAAIGTIAWQKSTVTNGVTGSFTTISGNTSTSLATGNLTTSTAYKVIVSSGACASSSTQTIITVSPKAVAKTISGAGAICNGMSKTLTLGTGSVGMIQWQSSTTSATATDFATIDGATSSVSLTVSPNVTTWYRVVATSGACAPAISAAVAVTVSQPTAVGTLSALNATLCKGTGTTITLSDAIGTIAWQKATVTNGVTGSFTTVAGNTSTTLATGNLTTSTAYRVIVSSGACSTSTTQTTIITVSPLSVAKTISGAGAICSGTSKTLTLVAGSVGAIQWQSSTTSATATDFANIDGATNPVSLTVSPNVTTWYRIVASSGACSSATSAAVAVTVSQPTAVGTLSALYSTVCTGTPTTMTLSSAVGTIAWQKATVTNGVTGTFTTVAGNTATLTTGNLTAKTAYKVIVSSGVCATSSSLPIVITVNPAAKATAITGFNTVTTPVCVGASQTLTLSAGYVGTIEWLIANTLNGTYTVIPGATGSTYDYFPSSTAVKYFKVRLTSSPCSTTKTSSVGVAVYAKNCVIAVPTASKVELADNTILDVKAYPNPFVNSFRLDLKTSNTELIKISLYDMTGRLIEVNEVEPSTVDTLEIGNTFPTGVYNLILTQGENTKVIRVIKR